MEKFKITFQNFLLTRKLHNMCSLFNLNKINLFNNMLLNTSNGIISRNFLRAFLKLSLCCIVFTFGFNKVKCDQKFSRYAQCAAQPVIRSKIIELNNIEKRASVLQFNANEPIEDRYSAYELKHFPGYFLAVLDGHGGAEVAEYANEKLYRYFDEIYKEIREKNKKLSEDEIVVNSLLKTFEKVEKEYYQIALEKFKEGNYRAGRVGSCVLITLVSKNKIYTAQLGDSKAKLFRKSNLNSDLYDVVKLSTTHNAEKKKEKEFLVNKFPKESDIVVCKRADGTICYVKGRLQPTRSLGDFHLKYKEFNDPSISKNPIKNFNGPYIQAIPEIKIVNIDRYDQFLVMASDGLWDFLESKDVSELFITKDKEKIDLVPADITQNLFDMVMNRAAEESNMTLKQIMNLPGGKRRNYYDDTTIIVFDLKH